jgi:hypothetical protein
VRKRSCARGDGERNHGGGRQRKTAAGSDSRDVQTWC